MTRRLRVTPKRPLRGTLRLPGDRHIGQLALLWAALADGESLVAGLASTEDHLRLCDALRAMGVNVAWTDAGVRVMGVGLRGLKLPKGALKAGASASTLEILTALLAAQHFGTRIEAEGAALEHSLRTVIGPLRARGAHVAGRNTEDGDVCAPVAVAPLLPGELLHEAEIDIPEGDAATKLALLVSGLYVPGVSVISEGTLSRDHAERALLALGVTIHTLGPVTLLERAEPLGTWPGFSWHIPGDFSLACYAMAAALAAPDSDLRIEGVSINRSRTAFLDLLRHAGAQVEVTPKGDAAGDEPLGDIRVRSSKLRGAKVSGELAQRLAADVGAVCALAPTLTGRLSVRDLASLRSRTPDPLRALGHALRQEGYECTEYDDGFDLERPPFMPLATAGTYAKSPEVALLRVLLALAAEEPCALDDVAHADALYPNFVESLAAVGAGLAWEELA
jgi:3-phosphoshikimate 1-carboxyvinyltransferase